MNFILFFLDFDFLFFLVILVFGCIGLNMAYCWVKSSLINSFYISGSFGTMLISPSPSSSGWETFLTDIKLSES